MKKILTLIMYVLPLAVAGQQLTGTVTGQNGRQLDAVTITLSQLGKNIISVRSDSGKFILPQVAPGSYELSATLIGYQPLNQTLNLPKDSVRLIMYADSKSLNEVTVTGSRPVIERKIDRITFNVENSITASGGNTWDALVKAPGVQSGPDNNLTANRKAVEIYMDGKPMHLSGDDLAGYLKGLPSDMVSQIEVFSIPPAQFDAQGAAVINIVTKKAKNQGLNVTLNASYIQATYASNTVGTSFNYRKDKLNTYGSYGYSHRKNFMDHNVFIDYGTSFWDGPNHNIYDNDSHNYRIGVDYQLAKNQVVGILITGNDRNGNREGHTITRVTRGDRSILDSTLQTATRAATSGHRYSYNLNYNLKTDSGRKGLNVDLDYSSFDSRSDSYVDNVAFLPNDNITGSTFNIYTPSTQQIGIYSGKADYTYRIDNVWNAAGGIKFSNIISRNKFDFFNNTGASIEPVPANGNRFDYRENTTAGFTSISGTIAHLNVQAGLRGEFTRTRGYSFTLDSLNKRSYFKMFPTVYLQYAISDNDELQFNYAYRIDRPEYARLNPAKHYSSPYNFYVGNPALQPTFVRTLELGYTYKKLYNVTAFYTNTHNMFTNVSQQDNATRQYYDTQQNLGLTSSIGLRAAISFTPVAWWYISINGEGYFQRNISSYLNGSYDYRIFAYAATINQSFTLDKSSGLKVEINGTYNSPDIQGIFRSGRNCQVDAGVKTSLMNGKAIVRLSASDIFNTNYYNIRVNYLNQNNGFFHRNETRNVTLSLSYRFGKNITVARSRTTASEEEKKRAQ